MASMLYQHVPSIIGLVGAGQLGTGLARLAAVRGIGVLLYDTQAHVLDRIMAIEKRYFDRWVACWDKGWDSPV